MRSGTSLWTGLGEPQAASRVTVRSLGSVLQPRTHYEAEPTVAKDGHKLVIVESPAKARTIAGFLGRGYVVESSIGHIR
ncbi:MAG: hypothetical protein H0U51_09300, partial [Propionibacteriales bacterium]|nr:hypothetical protein [Propionibacteriales bacterium]